MASAKQIAANRRNAKVSTGPNSEAGRKISRLNALKHGITAETVIIEGEEEAEFNALRDRLFEDFCPSTAMAVELTARLAALLWRLKRVPAFEAALFEVQREKIPGGPEDPAKAGSRDTVFAGMAKKYNLPQPKPTPPAEKMDPDEERKKAEAEKEEAARKQFARLGLALIDDAKTLDALGRLTRYEAHLARAAERIAQQLERLKEKNADDTAQKRKIIDINPN